MLKVKPKSFDSPTGRKIAIVAINARFINEFPVSISPVESYRFYIEYITEEGERRDAMNATSEEFSGFLLAKGLTEEQVEATLSQVFGAMLVGTREQRYKAISSLVSFYGYELLPIEEQ